MSESDARPSCPPDAGPSVPARPMPWWRRVGPFVLAIALVGYVLARIDWPTFWAGLRRVSYPAFAGFMVAFILLLLAADALATSHVYRRAVAPVSWRDLLVIRGASYLPSMLNHHVGQAWLTYFVSRAHGVALGRVAGATLVVYATWAGCILGLGGLAIWLSALPSLWLLLPLGAGVGYLVLLALKPAALARNRVLAPLFEAGVRGHLLAMLVRLPHTAVLFFGSWLPFHFFGVDIPWTTAIGTVPIIMVAVTLPLTPQGFGTRDLLAATFFQSWVTMPGLEEEQRRAIVAAATTTQGVAITLIGLVVGTVLMPRALRRLRATESGVAAAPPAG